MAGTLTVDTIQSDSSYASTLNVASKINFTSGMQIGGQDTTFGGMRNRIINGAMVIFQRGTAVTTDAAYSVDRWRLVKSNDATESVSQNTDAPVGFSYSLRNTISTGDSVIGSSQYSGFEQAIEGYNIADLGWGTANAKPITISFWVRSSITGTYTGNVRNTNDTRINPFNFTINAANTWEQKTITVTGDTGGTWQSTTSTGIIFAIYAAIGSSYIGGTAGTWGTTPAFGCGSPVNGIASNGNIFAISGVQLEKGSVASAFENRQYGTELALCQRYFQRRSSEGVTYASFGTGGLIGSNVLYQPINTLQTMRAAPSMSSTAANTFRVDPGNVSGTSLAFERITTNGYRINVTTASLTGSSGEVHSDFTNLAYIDASAEL